MYLLPFIDSNGHIQDGVCIKASNYCKKKCISSKCKRYYQQLAESPREGFYTCPEGFSTFYCERNNEKIVFSGFKCKNHFSKAKKTQEASFCPILLEEHCMEMINASIEHQEQQALLDLEKKQYEENYHEIKALNSFIKNHSESLIQLIDIDSDCKAISDDQANTIADKVKTIWVSSCMVISRYSMIDYENNNSIFQTQSKNKASIYGKFEKCTKLLRGYNKSKVKIVLENNTYKYINAYTSFELIPLLLLENAIKYSDGNEVVVSFIEGHPSTNQVIVEIHSFGPYCSPSEIDHIFEKGFRGSNAIKHADGSGIGLYFVKILCDLHNISISVSSELKTVGNNQTQVGSFNVKLVFHDVFSK